MVPFTPPGVTKPLLAESFLQPKRIFIFNTSDNNGNHLLSTYMPGTSLV